VSEDTADTAATTDTAPGAAKRAKRARKPSLDAAAGGAVELARAAAEDVAEAGSVGEHLDASAEGDRIVSHAFACLLPGYRGWRWTVTVTRASRAKNVTVNEVCLLPGEDALQAPTWLPWDQRIAPGDVGPGGRPPPRPGLRVDQQRRRRRARPLGTRSGSRTRPEPGGPRRGRDPLVRG
jgi:hypothetical protein